MTKAVGWYEIDVSSSTEDTNGNWKGPALYDELLAACPPIDATAKEKKHIDVTANEKKRKERRPLKPVGANQKKQKVLESFFVCPPTASLSDVEAVEMVAADDLESEPGRSAAARIDVALIYSAACMMMCDNNVVPVDFLIFVRCVLDRKPRIRARTVIKRK